MPSKKKDLEKLLDQMARLAVERCLLRPKKGDDVAMPGCFVRHNRASSESGNAAVSVPAAAAASGSTMPQARYVNITYDNIHQLIRAHMPLTTDCVIKVCDAFVTTYPEDVFLMFMDYAIERHDPKYSSEQFDCDDFSVVFCSTARKWHARVSSLMRHHTVAPQDQADSLTRPSCAPGAAYIVPRTANATLSDMAPTSQDASARAYAQIGGSPIGMCHGRLSGDSVEHAFNFWISPSGDPIYIEPQTGEFVTFGTGAMIDFVYI